HDVKLDIMRDRVWHDLRHSVYVCFFFFFQAEDGIRDRNVTGVQTCALPICTTSCGFQIAQRIENRTKSYYLLSYCSPSRAATHRSEERRVGKEWRSRRATCQ